MFEKQCISVTNFHKLPSAGGSSPPPFNFHELKSGDLPKLWFFKLIMTKSNFKKSIMTSFQWCYCFTSPKSVIILTSLYFPFWVSPNQNFWLHRLFTLLIVCLL